MNNFAKQRKKAGFSESDVSTSRGVTQGAVSQWETGECFPQVKLLPDIAALYGCTIDTLLTGDKKSPLRDYRKEPSHERTQIQS